MIPGSKRCVIAKIEAQDAIDAVAEYIAANDEYDAAWEAMRFDQSSECGDKFNAVRDRRALAHARMKGETK